VLRSRRLAATSMQVALSQVSVLPLASTAHLERVDRERARQQCGRLGSPAELEEEQRTHVEALQMLWVREQRDIEILQCRSPGLYTAVGLCRHESGWGSPFPVPGGSAERS
jgi:hypothetical protein